MRVCVCTIYLLIYRSISMSDILISINISVNLMVHDLSVYIYIYR